MLPTYPHIDHIFKVPELECFNKLYGFEKVHGTNARIGWVNGQLVIGGRTTELSEANRGHGDFWGWVQKNSSWLAEAFKRQFPESDVTVFGEFYGPGIQKGINYGNEKNFIAFDVQIGDSLLDLDDMMNVVYDLGFITPPLVYCGRYDVEVMLTAINLNSIVADNSGVNDPDNIMEGIVVRPPIMLKNKHGQWVMGKLKNATFEERASARKDPANPVDQTEAIAFADEWVTEMRFNHVLDSMKEAGIPVIQQHTGDFLKMMSEDVMRESGIEKEDWKKYSRSVTNKAKELWNQAWHVSFDSSFDR